MRLSNAFVRLPWQFDVGRLVEACAAFDAADWRAHPQDHAGNTALPLVAVHGDPADDGVAGPMAPTPLLQRSPYLQQVLASLRAPIGRTRLMRLAPGAEATPHVDIHYYWQQRLRVHVPIATTPEVRFVCGDAQVHMEAGECWVFDTWRLHNVFNASPYERIHLVIDTVGSAGLWHAIAGDAGALQPAHEAEAALRYEQFNLPVVMSPWELEALWADWLADACEAPQGPQAALAVNQMLLPLLRDWRAHWAVHGDRASGWPGYEQLRSQVVALGQSVAGKIKLPNGVDLGRLLRVGLAPALCNPGLGASAPDAAPPAPARSLGQDSGSPRATAASLLGDGEKWPRRSVRPVGLERPLIIVGAPRSGSTLLFETLAACLPVYTVQGESHRQIEQFAALRPDARGFDSNRLVRADASEDMASALRQAFWDSMRDRSGAPPLDGAQGVRLLEKTPKNALRVPFLDAVFPDACFIYLVREPRDNIASLIEGWQSRRFVTYPHLPGWQGPPWSFLLIEGWRELAARPVAAIAAAQWQQAHSTLLDDLAAVPAERVHALRYEDFLQDPQAHVNAIAGFAGLAPERPVPAHLPVASHTLTPPAPGKWRQHEQAMADWLPALEPLAERARQFVQRVQARRAAETPS